MLNIIYEELITKQADAVVSKPETGCEYMFNNTRWEDLKLMYKILEKGTNVLNLIITRMGPYIESRGDAIVED